MVLIPLGPESKKKTKKREKYVTRCRVASFHCFGEPHNLLYVDVTDWVSQHVDRGYFRFKGCNRTCLIHQVRKINRNLHQGQVGRN